MPPKTQARAQIRRALAACLGRRGARAAYDAVSATRELAWNALRRRCYPSYWRRARATRARNAREIAVHGEFGDAILALPFLYRERAAHPGARMEVVIKGPAAGTASRTRDDPFAERGLRAMDDGAGHPISFLRAFWQRVPFVDAVREGDVTDPRFRYWQPQPAFALQGRSVGPSDYAPFLDTLFTNDDRLTAEAAWPARRPLRVVAHLRRAADEIAQLLRLLDADAIAPSCSVALLGSRRHERIPQLDTTALDVVDLTDNYEKGLPIMPLLAAVRTADLFIGGRGGFELFALAAGVPALTLFDEDGWWERRRLWPRRLWDENPLGGFAFAAGLDARATFDGLVRPWLARRLAARHRPQAVEAPP